jgi:hypothetical protein
VEFTFSDPVTGARMRSSPHRDIAYYIPRFLEDLADRLERPLPAEEMRLLEAAGGTLEDVRAAFAAVYNFVALSVDVDVKTPQACAEKSGLAAVNPAARAMVLHRFGQAILASVWAGVRSSLMADECPPVYQSLLRRAEEMLDRHAAGGPCSPPA